MAVEVEVKTVFSNPFFFLCFSLGLDILIGDPPYAWHPIRLMGRFMVWLEAYLRNRGWEGRLGGFLLFLGLVLVFGGAIVLVRQALATIYMPVAWIWELYLAYSFLAMGDLVAHARRIAKATLSLDIVQARAATAMLVGRDTDQMDFKACNRAAIESVAESLVDGVIAPLFWFMLFGLPGLFIFKIASTMDSMVGYKNARYIHFGWFGARLDDVMNYIPARLGWLLIVLCAAILPKFSARKAWSIGWSQHALLPGPNKGWSETAAAGALQIKLAGPIYKQGLKVNDLWIGFFRDREGGEANDVSRMVILAYAAVLLFLVVAWFFYWQGLMDWRI
jgi:adenosylcobinamide-phosphate synthase